MKKKTTKKTTARETAIRNRIGQLRTELHSYYKAGRQYDNAERIDEISAELARLLDELDGGPH